jgi:hypothetical protein
MRYQYLPKGLGRLRKEIASSVVSAIRVTATPAAKALPSHTSKIGGSPYIPEGFRWPVDAAGNVVPFIAQINFAEVGKLMPAYRGRLPTAGLLQLFCTYPMDASVDRKTASDDSWYHLTWHQDLSRGTGVPVANGVARAIKEATLTFSEGFSLPGSGLLDRRGWMLATKRQVDTYEALLPRPRHQLLGAAWAVKQDPRWGVSQAEPWWEMPSSIVASRKKRREMMAERQRKVDGWRLLWQLDSDERCGLQWGDKGTAYVLVEEQALRRGDLSSVRLDVQWK